MRMINSGHIAAAVIQQHQINVIPATSSALISKEIPKKTIGAATNKPVRILLTPTIHDFGLSLGKKGSFESL